MIEKGRLHPGLKQLLYTTSHLCKHMHRQHGREKGSKEPIVTSTLSVFFKYMVTLIAVL